MILVCWILKLWSVVVTVVAETVNILATRPRHEEMRTHFNKSLGRNKTGESEFLIDLFMVKLQEDSPNFPSPDH